MGNGLISHGDKIHLDWFKVYSQARLQRYLASSSGTAADFIQYLSPFGENYYSPLNPVFLAECESLRELTRARTWLARDGLVPLYWFFSKFPEPGPFRGRLLVHEDLAASAPPAWMKNLGVYRFGQLPASQVSRNYFQFRDKCENLLLLGINSPAYCSLPRLEELLATARKKFRLVFGRPPKKISLCLTQKVELLSTQEETSRHANQAMLSVCREFGTEVEILDIRDFQMRNSFNGYALAELSEGLLCVDNALTHTAVAKGACLLETPLKRGYDRYVETAPGYGFGILDQAPAGKTEAKRAAALETRIGEAICSPANTHFPWHGWLGSESSRRLVSCRFTGRPRFIFSQKKRFTISSRGFEGELEVIYLGADRIELHGWCMDKEGLRPASEISVFRGLESVSGKLERTARADVQRSKRSGFDERIRPGFIFQLSRRELGNLDSRERYSIYGLFERGFAASLGHFRFDPKRGTSLRLSPNGGNFGTYLPARLDDRSRTLSIALGDERAKSIVYEVAKPGDTTEQLRAVVDHSQVQDGHHSLLGWGADLKTYTPAEAVAIMNDRSQALVIPVQEWRPDLFDQFGPELEVSGFRAIAPWETPRAFMLFDGGTAIELPLGGKSPG